MLIFPAIDLYEGKAVRLYKGDYGQMTVYSEDPPEVARAFKAAGAGCIHLVDLEGAKTGETPNLGTVKRIISAAELYSEIGGGIRGMRQVETYLEAGVDRVILGTAAVTDRAFLKEACRAYPGRVAVGADIKDGYVAIKGWLEKSQYDARSFCREMQELGIGTIICTDISRDGAMRGANLELYRELSEEFSMDITASGGVSGMDDIIKLKELGLYGAIIGKAWYTGAIDLGEAVRIAEQE